MKKGFILIIMLLILVFLLISRLEPENDPEVVLLNEKEFKTFMNLTKSEFKNTPDRTVWKKVLPYVKSISIKSTLDLTDQPALFYDSGSRRQKPLLVALHSWSEDYQQHYSVPYGLWAMQNDWVFIHPDYRGPFNNPQATASEPAIRDILDAVDYAKKNARIDESRIYIAGFSGGAMVALIMAGRYPDIWAGAVAWVPVYDLEEWYSTTKNAKHDYSSQIAASCGGAPLPGTQAAAECKKRSPSTYLKNARGKVPVYIATGVDDRFVPPGHSIEAFNDLADVKDRFSQSDISYINNNYRLPEHLAGKYSERLYSDAGVELLLQRMSDRTVLNIFDGGHDIIYNAGLYWLSRQKK
jgi:acetyl esterase/lipase